MAVAFNVANSGNVDNATSISFTGPNVSGDNRLLLAHVSRDTPGVPNDPTWNGVAMTLHATGTGNINTRVYKLVAPATGANTYSQDGFDANTDIIVQLISFTGVDQTTPVDAKVEDSGVGTSASNSVTSAVDNIVVDFLDKGGTTDATAGADQTLRTSDTHKAGQREFCSTEAGAASVTMSWSWTTSTDFGHLSFDVNAAAAENPRFLMLLGVGQ